MGKTRIAKARYGDPEAVNIHPSPSPPHHESETEKSPACPQDGPPPFLRPTELFNLPVWLLFCVDFFVEETSLFVGLFRLHLHHNVIHLSSGRFLLVLLATKCVLFAQTVDEANQ